MEKHPACAAPISSSGLVPVPSSKRDEKEYCPSNAPLPRATLPEPLFRSPCHSARAVRVAIVVLLNAWSDETCFASGIGIKRDIRRAATRCGEGRQFRGAVLSVSRGKTRHCSGGTSRRTRPLAQG